MGWRIIEIDKNAHVKLFLNNLIVSGDIKMSIPINDIDVVLFSNSRTNVSVNLLNYLANQNVCVFFCDEKYMPCAVVNPIVGNLFTLKIFNEQIKWSTEFKNKAWKKIVEIKCENQFKYLKHLNLLPIQIEKDISKYISEIEDGDATNREGHIAKIYWHILFGIEFSRTKEHLIINQILNYGYTVINAMIARSIIKKGLDCRISLFHKSVYNQFALSSDLIEPFRNIVDILVVELLKNNLITKGDGVLTIELKEICLDFIANFKLLINGLSQQLNNAIDEFVDSLVNKNIEKVTIEYFYDVETIKEEKQDYFHLDEENVKV